MGRNVHAFQEEAAHYFGVKHAIGVASGTDALMLSLTALGIGRGDDVLVPTFTYAATAAAVCHLGARPVFVDSLPNGFNMDPKDAERRLTPKTRALIPVHLYGEAAPMDEIMALARARGVRVVEDVAQAAGARYGGRALGAIGATGCFSFYPTKNLAACGDAGMVITDDDAVAERVLLLRQQADASVLGGRKYFHPTVGFNSRLDEMQAAILRVKLPHLDSWNQLRIQHADRYRSLLADCGLALPARSLNGSHVYCLYTVRSSCRDDLYERLRRNGIGAEIYYPLPLHLQEAYRFLGHQKGDFPVAERLAEEVLSIPIYPELANEELDKVGRVVRESVSPRPGLGAEEKVV
jgi:dTDP-4-amino-4,6-dideoxygalactose transaminase